MEPIGRRAFLRRAALAGLSAPVGAALFAACRASVGSSPSPVAGASALPVDPGTTLASGLPAERGAVLKVYEWKDYLSSRVIRSFEEAYASSGVRVQVESFLHIDEAVARLQQPDADFDVTFPTIDVLASMVATGLLRPLNHDYLPHVENLWPFFLGAQGPFYDPGQRYTTPYTVYSSGIGWRADTVAAADAPDVRADPYAILWDRRYRGRVGMYDDYLEAISLALQRDGVGDVRDATEAQLRAAGDLLAEAVRDAGLAFTVDGAQEGLAEGTFAAHQAWSGDILSAPRYVREEGGDAATLASELRYWSPEGATKVVGCDLTAICAQGRNPVLAHAFLDHLLRFDVALDNFAWNGYQVPMDGATPERFADPAFPWHGAVPDTLLPTLLTPEAFGQAQWLVGFGPSERAAWLDQWKRVAPASAPS
ncbi:MAG: polyamine ABC transporter substrate-binding protein [Actinomycetota bacterium]